MSQNTIKLQQESFFILNDAATTRRKIVRQDRWETEPLQCYISSNEFVLEVTNLSAFGCACIVNESQFSHLKSHIENATGIIFKIIYTNIETQTVSLKPVRFSKTEPDSYSVGFETINESINVDRCQAINEANNIISTQQSDLTKMQSIPFEFRTVVFDLQHWFTSLKNQIDDLEKKSPMDNAKTSDEYRLTIAEVISEYLGKYLPSVYQKIPPQLQELKKTEKDLCVSFIREQLGPFVYGAPFASRAFYKPRGYAGDYEMMNHLYRSEMVGRTLFDQCMHKYFIEEPAANAVKNRGEYLHQKIRELVRITPKEKTLKIMSIASGPAMEVQLFVERNPEFYGRQIEFTCIDQDEESLKHAQKQLLSLDRQKKSGFKFKFSNLAIKNIIAQGLPEKDFDLIYSAGLFDYFTDPVAVLAAKQMFAGVKTGGQVIIGNYSKDNPTAALMEIVLDWILIYRSKNDMANLFSSIGKNLEIEQEPLKINLFANIYK